MIDKADKRGQLIRHLEDALALADEIDDGRTRYLIERALDEMKPTLAVVRLQRSPTDPD
jgi:hypothetical protein